MEVGWQVYGEQYQRGIFLVNMRQLVRDLGLIESPELPDHLTHILPVLGRIDPEDASILAGRWVLPSVEKMADVLAKEESPYESVLRCIAEVLVLLGVESMEAVS